MLFWLKDPAASAARGGGAATPDALPSSYPPPPGPMSRSSEAAHAAWTTSAPLDGGDTLSPGSPDGKFKHRRSGVFSIRSLSMASPSSPRSSSIPSPPPTPKIPAVVLSPPAEQSDDVSEPYHHLQSANFNFLGFTSRGKQRGPKRASFSSPSLATLSTSSTSSSSPSSANRPSSSRLSVTVLSSQNGSHLSPPMADSPLITKRARSSIQLPLRGGSEVSTRSTEGARAIATGSVNNSARSVGGLNAVVISAAETSLEKSRRRSGSLASPFTEVRAKSSLRSWERLEPPVPPAKTFRGPTGRHFDEKLKKERFRYEVERALFKLATRKLVQHQYPHLRRGQQRPLWQRTVLFQFVNEVAESNPRITEPLPPLLMPPSNKGYAIGFDGYRGSSSSSLPSLSSVAPAAEQDFFEEIKGPRVDVERSKARRSRSNSGGSRRLREIERLKLKPPPSNLRYGWSISVDEDCADDDSDDESSGNSVMRRPSVDSALDGAIFMK